MVRFKNRYIVCRARQEGEAIAIASAAVHEAILRAVEALHGNFGCASVKGGFKVCYSSSGAIFVIRVRLGPHKLLLSSLPFLSDIKKQHVVLDTLYMGATLHHCYKFIKKLRIQEISDAIRNTEDPEVRAELARSLDRALDAK